MGDSESEYKVSSYNSSELKNLQLHDLWRCANTACINGLYDRWNTYLDLIFGELVGDIILDKKGNCKEDGDYNGFNKRLKETGSLKIGDIKGFKSNKNTNRDVQYNILQEKHIWLKRLQTKLNRGTRFKDEFEDDFD